MAIVLPPEELAESEDDPEDDIDEAIPGLCVLNSSLFLWGPHPHTQIGMKVSQETRWVCSAAVSEAHTREPSKAPVRLRSNPGEVPQPYPFTVPSTSPPAAFQAELSTQVRHRLRRSGPRARRRHGPEHPRDGHGGLLQHGRAGAHSSQLGFRVDGAQPKMLSGLMPSNSKNYETSRKKYET